ncbi:MAG: hypothetical protein EOP83_03400 [Verrucomicrobiaceae bacterium]|nr:MAG: hypothetical protein EOP83_03400 [Verrucomicrobiaceae bacterium]
MKNESKLVLEIWELVRDQLTPAKRLDTAIALLQSMESYGFEERDLHDVLDEDPYLTRAFREVFDIEDEDQDSHEDHDE